MNLFLEIYPKIIWSLASFIFDSWFYSNLDFKNYIQSWWNWYFIDSKIADFITYYEVKTNNW